MIVYDEDQGLAVVLCNKVPIPLVFVGARFGRVRVDAREEAQLWLGWCRASGFGEPDHSWPKEKLDASLEQAADAMKKTAELSCIHHFDTNEFTVGLQAKGKLGEFTDALNRARAICPWVDGGELQGAVENEGGYDDFIQTLESTYGPKKVNHQAEGRSL